ncbi:DUF6817 domain-containing protein [Yinghuangia seranimata]|uniref:DUF6817 domain-containing protein n=1 Tax=Yinghuangia seranimata TaxID=408067 RepID=UPI00248B5BF4|nr:hypothetical protein [Yinghuangia seranimata]
MVTKDAVALLRELGAEDVPHFGGSLFDHLVRVHDMLTEWGAERDVRLAGLCHAFYGTAGFDTALLGLDRRGELAAVIGEHAEAMVYFYASCDRKASYPELADDAGEFLNRFTGERRVPGLAERRAFAEITAANEIDVIPRSPTFDQMDAEFLFDMFEEWRALLSEPAWREVQRQFGD